MGAYSGWLSGYDDSTIARLNMFYDMYPDKLPNYIYIPENNQWNMDLFISEVIDKYGHTLISDNGAVIYRRE